MKTIKDGSSESLTFETTVAAWDAFKQAIYLEAFNKGEGEDSLDDEKFLSQVDKMDELIMEMMDSFEIFKIENA
jgi:hypothetical protein